VAAVQNKPVTPVQVFTPVLEVELPQVQSAEFADNPSVCAHPGVVEPVVVVPFSTQCSSEALARCKQLIISQYWVLRDEGISPVVVDANLASLHLPAIDFPPFPDPPEE